ncbi:hypothetical protein Ahy_B03g066531 [Arachis hypogaea]|uniref:Uncharacterized protein n=1 Tax=Arachis hypogaea TaxID=3818 RepID=A0A445A465_ARAHY|nr:hypothetical protein Ahy_B03g066531 [Arachis hypogaea]
METQGKERKVGVAAEINECTTFHTTSYYEPCYICSSSQVPDNKLVPIISCPGVAMWQFMSPIADDT